MFERSSAPKHTHWDRSHGDQLCKVHMRSEYIDIDADICQPLYDHFGRKYDLMLIEISPPVFKNSTVIDDNHGKSHGSFEIWEPVFLYMRSFPEW